MIKDSLEVNGSSSAVFGPSMAVIPPHLRALARPMDAGAGETLFRTRDPVRHIFLVLRGEARLVRSDRHGNAIVLQRSRGGFIAEASLDSRTYHCDAVAAEPSQLQCFPVGAFRRALESETAFRRGWQALLAKEVRKLRAQCERLSLNSATDRVIHYLADEGNDGTLTLHTTKKAWAAELGLSHEALYRTLKRMQESGQLLIEGKRLTMKRLVRG